MVMVGGGVGKLLYQRKRDHYNKVRGIFQYKEGNCFNRRRETMRESTPTIPSRLISNFR